MLSPPNQQLLSKFFARKERERLERESRIAQASAILTHVDAKIAAEDDLYAFWSVALDEALTKRQRSAHNRYSAHRHHSAAYRAMLKDLLVEHFDPLCEVKEAKTKIFGIKYTVVSW